ncbi:MAG: bifunctional DNA-formamidopyrimidine glycosylase/DNA-(apurinic or apyrimidinic site) lyase [Gemmatimonadetes bacterium]|nr:bifunctional DNA-formamidopyrimidine glycosylase/DNA-(apurinic or apyrimidinic site) lyase [Gemmatimonadota bacterium]
MPELPEAETIARALREGAIGRTIARVRVIRPDVVANPARLFQRRLVGRRILDLQRRAKSIVFHLDDGSLLAVSLGMTGRLLMYRVGRPRRADMPPHAAVILETDPPGMIVYDDVRRFGRLELLDAAGWAARSAALGPEPLEDSFTLDVLGAILAPSRAPIRSLLLDQRKIAGVGNIYANEALFGARIHPARLAGTLQPAEVRRLHKTIRSVLARAIEARGTTIRDYRDPNGDSGGFAPRLVVYDRAGSRCRRCGTVIERTVFGGRSAFFCPSCQPAARVRVIRRRRNART